MILPWTLDPSEPASLLLGPHSKVWRFSFGLRASPRVTPTEMVAQSRVMLEALNGLVRPSTNHPLQRDGFQGIIGVSRNLTFLRLLNRKYPLSIFRDERDAEAKYHRMVDDLRLAPSIHVPARFAKEDFRLIILRFNTMRTYFRLPPHYRKMFINGYNAGNEI
ncbi:MAG: hypothetical protein AABW68_05550 [archaeon]